MMRSLLSTFVSVMLGAGLAFASAAQEVTGSLENQDVPVSKPSGTASGYPPTGGKGPGSGRSYQQGTAGPDQGSPNYRGGRGTEPAPTIDPATPDATQGAGPASVTPPPAIPGPYSNAPGTGSTHYRGRGYPSSGGRGYGYGRGTSAAMDMAIRVTVAWVAGNIPITGSLAIPPAIPPNRPQAIRPPPPNRQV